jgi:hypothetical protein
MENSNGTGTVHACMHATVMHVLTSRIQNYIQNYSNKFKLVKMTDKNKERCIHACRMMEPCIDHFFFLICFPLDIYRPLAGVGLPHRTRIGDCAVCPAPAVKASRKGRGGPGAAVIGMHALSSQQGRRFREHHTTTAPPNPIDDGASS